MFALPAILDQIILETGMSYCPLDATDLYTIIFDIIPQEDNSNYCPLDATDLYTIL